MNAARRGDILARMRTSTLASLGAAVCLVIATTACSATDGSEFGEEGGTGTGAGSGHGSGGLTTVGAGGGTGGGNQQGCGEGAELVYVLSAENDLYSFRPDMKQFTKIGPLQCQTTMQPNSMAIDRNAVAWVNYVENDGIDDTAGAVFEVSTSNASCKPPNITLPASWYRLGMGFSTDMAGGTTEKLFVAGTGPGIGMGNSPGLGLIDFTTNGLTPIGQFTGALSGQSGELTGTGDARLFGFFTTTPVQLAEIDKPTGATPTPKQLAGVETPSFWAFSFWGGDFYLYTCPDATLDPTRTTNVTKYSPTDGTINTSYMLNIGFRIVGAGVSTCAPLVPPS